MARGDDGADAGDAAFRRFFDQAIDLFCIAGLDGRIRRVNPAWEAALGWSAAELRGRPWIDLVHPDDVAATRAATEALARGEAVRRFVNRYRAKDGGWRSLEWSAVTTGEDGLIYATVRDVTEDRRAAAHAAEIEAISGVGSWEVDLDGGRVYWSPSVCALLGVAPGTALPVEQALAFFTDEARAVFEPALARLTETGAPFDLDLPFVTSGGERRWGRSTSAVEMREGRPARVYGTFQDVTEARRAERRLADVLRGANAGTWEWNALTGETVFNERWAEMIGYTLADLETLGIGTWRRFVHPDDLAASDALIAAHFAGETEFYRCEVRMRHRDGRWIWVLDLGRLHTRTAEGEPWIMSGAHVDITEQKAQEAALARAHGRLRATLDAMPDVLLELDGEGRFVDCHSRSPDLLAAPPETFIGRRLEDVMPPEIAALGRAIMGEVDETGRSVGRQYRLEVARGLRRFEISAAAKAPDAPGGAGGYVLLTRDVTERVEAQAALGRRDAMLSAVARASRRLLAGADWRAEAQALLDALGAAAGVDRAYLFLAREDGATALFDQVAEWCAEGVAPEIGNPALQGLDMEAMGFAPWLDRLGRGESVVRVSVAEMTAAERAVLDPQGVVGLCVHPVVANGRLAGFVGYDRCRPDSGHGWPEPVMDALAAGSSLLGAAIEMDRTHHAQARANAELRRALAERDAAERRFFDIAAISPDWFWEQDADLRFTFISRSRGYPSRVETVDFMGRTREEVLAQNPAMRAAADWDGLARRLAAREPFEDFLYPILSPRHEPLWVRISGAPFHDETGAFAGYRGVGSDVTQLYLAKERAEAASRAKSQFLANMSHEIRTPLNGVLGMAAVLDEVLADPHHKRLLGVIRESGELLLGVINDILDVSKIEAGRLDLEAAPFRPLDLARKIEGPYTLKATEKDVAFGVRTSGAPERARLGDAHRVMQILHNLCGNAMKFTERGSVAVTLDCPADGPLTLVVRDTGIGMTEAQVARVFDDFTQADASTTRRYGGTGLGMSIVRRLVEAMAGEIAIESRLGAGTTIRVALPLPLAGGAPVAAPAPEPAAEGPIRARVLVAEDNEINRMVLEALLARLGVTFVMTRDGGDAVARFRDGGFDALLLDISMPGMDGPEALAAIRAFEAAAGLAPTPAVAVTANALSHQVEAFLAAGFAAHVAKPIEADRLAAALRRVLAAA